MMLSMYLRGNRWTMTGKSRRRPSLWRIGLLIALIGAALYINQVVVPATPPLFIPTPTPTQSPESVLNKAEALARSGKLALAIDAYKEAINTDPGNPASYVALARLQVFNGQYEDAIRNTQNALLKNPNNPLAHAVQGWALGFLEKYGEAEVEIRKALELDENSALAHAYYAEILINQGDVGRLDKAADESRKALELDNTLLETHRARGIVLYNTQNLQEAVEQFQAALAINKNIADVHLYLGITYKALEQYDLAEESLLAAYTLNPTDTVGLTELSRSYFANGRFAQAAQYAEEAIKVQPGDPRLHGNLGIIYYKSQDYAKAIPELKLATKGGQNADGVMLEGLPLDYNPRTMEYYWYYGFALARSNQCAEAVPIFLELLDKVPDNEIAVYNAQEGLNVCKENIVPSEPEPTAEITPTP